MSRSRIKHPPDFHILKSLGIVERSRHSESGSSCAGDSTDHRSHRQPSKMKRYDPRFDKHSKPSEGKAEGMAEKLIDIDFDSDDDDDDDDGEEDTLYDQRKLLRSSSSPMFPYSETKESRRVERCRAALVFVAFVNIGLCLGIVGPTLPDLQSNTATASFHSTVSLISANSVGAILAVVIGTVIFKYANPLPVMMVSLLCLSVLTLIIPWSHTLSGLNFVFLLQGFCMGLLERGGFSMASSYWKRNFRLIHSLFIALSIGGMLSTLFASPFIAHRFITPNSTLDVLSNQKTESWSNTTESDQSLQQAINDEQRIMRRFKREVNDSDDYIGSVNSTAIKPTKPLFVIKDLGPDNDNSSLHQDTDLIRGTGNGNSSGDGRDIEWEVPSHPVRKPVMAKGEEISSNELTWTDKKMKGLEISKINKEKLEKLSESSKSVVPDSQTTSTNDSSVENISDSFVESNQFATENQTVGNNSTGHSSTTVGVSTYTGQRISGSVETLLVTTITTSSVSSSVTSAIGSISTTTVETPTPKSTKAIIVIPSTIPSTSAAVEPNQETSVPPKPTTPGLVAHDSTLGVISTAIPPSGSPQLTTSDLVPNPDSPNYYWNLMSQISGRLNRSQFAYILAGIVSLVSSLMFAGMCCARPCEMPLTNPKPPGKSSGDAAKSTRNASGGRSESRLPPAGLAVGTVNNRVMERYRTYLMAVLFAFQAAISGVMASIYNLWPVYCVVEHQQDQAAGALTLTGFWLAITVVRGFVTIILFKKLSVHTVIVSSLIASLVALSLLAVGGSSFSWSAIVIIIIFAGIGLASIDPVLYSWSEGQLNFSQWPISVILIGGHAGRLIVPVAVAAAMKSHWPGDLILSLVVLTVIGGIWYGLAHRLARRVGQLSLIHTWANHLSSDLARDDEYSTNLENGPGRQSPGSGSGGSSHDFDLGHMDNDTSDDIDLFDNDTVHFERTTEFNGRTGTAVPNGYLKSQPLHAMAGSPPVGDGLARKKDPGNHSSDDFADGAFDSYFNHK